MQANRSRRYTVLIADRETGVIRRFGVRLRPATAIVATALALPILIGLGARWSAMTEIEHLHLSNAALQMENANYRAATGHLTSQISSLQAAIDDLGREATLDPTSRTAIEQLPGVLKSRAMGGGHVESSDRLLSAAFLSPENTFGVLRHLLGNLEDRLQIVRDGVERRQALAAAIPSIWPAHGWLSAGYGFRPDPFTGERDFHPALDISTDRGQPVFATAAGVVESASYSGAYGNLAIIHHGFGLVTRYGHLARFTVRRGDRVTRGQIIGYVGATGRATGTHVHYEIWANGRPLNPLRLLAAPIGPAN